MAWTNISNALVSVGALPFATTIQALRDNPIAIANGDAGAPQIQTAAIANTAVTAAKLATGNNERDWVLARTAGAVSGAVGTYAFLQLMVGVTVNNNGTRAGSDLAYANAAGVNGTPVSGTWRNMGGTVFGSGSAGAGATTLWLRIS
jgi:hypothetical protein